MRGILLARSEGVCRVSGLFADFFRSIFNSFYVDSEVEWDSCACLVSHTYRDTSCGLALKPMVHVFPRLESIGSFVFDALREGLAKAKEQQQTRKMGSAQ